MATESAALICQSCSMPLIKPEERGTEADGAPSDEYCTYCYQNGSFTNPSATLDEMVETLMGFVDEPDAKAREAARVSLSPLKRWRNG